MSRKLMPPGLVKLLTEIIEVQLACNADGSVDRTAPFVVLAQDEERAGAGRRHHLRHAGRRLRQGQRAEHHGDRHE